MNPALWVTVARIALVVPMVALFCAPGAWGIWGPGLVLVAAGASDALDGWLARRLDCVTELGAALDPVADKVVVAAALVLLAGDGRAPAVAAAALIARELLVSGLREALRSSPGLLAVSGLAKAKTAVQFAALALLLLAPGLPASGGLALAGSVLLWIAVALSLASGAGYVRRAVRAAAGKGG